MRHFPRYKISGKLRQQRSRGKLGNTYYQRYRLDDPEAPVQSVSLKASDKSAISRKDIKEAIEAKILREMEEQHQKEHPHEGKSYSEHLEDYVAEHAAKGGSAKHTKNVKAQIKVIGEGCQFERIEQIEPGKITIYLDERKQSGQTGEQGLIHYRAAIKQFTKWLAGGTVKRLDNDPLANFPKKPKGDAPIQRRRRIFTEAEVDLLIANTFKRPVSWKMTGKERAILYLAALQTGFRAQELASITPACCFLDDELPFIRIDCRISKRRTYDEQQIQPELAKLLSELCENKEEDERLWGSSWWRRAKEMLYADLPPEVTRETRHGHLFFHGTRHTFNTRVFKSISSMALGMKVTRLSSIALVERYFKPEAEEIRSTIRKLPTAKLPDVDEQESDD